MPELEFDEWFEWLKFEAGEKDWCLYEQQYYAHYYYNKVTPPEALRAEMMEIS